jgi:hypothetical protein
MSTRAMYTFIEPDHKDAKRGFHVYKHHDGYPSGAAEAIEAAQEYAWQLGRFEADEFAAAFVAGNKSHYHRQELSLLREMENTSDVVGLGKIRETLLRCRDYQRNYAGGGVHLMASGSPYAVAPSDIEYRYEITSKAGELWVTAYETSFWETRTKANEKRIFKGSLEAFKTFTKNSD